MSKNIDEMNDRELISYYKKTKENYDVYNNMQNAIKVEINSAYGFLGNQYARFYDIRLATAITLSGQLSIRWIEQEVNTYLNGYLNTKGVDYVIASDTDSVYLNLEKLVDTYWSDLSKSEIVDKLDAFSESHIVPFMAKSYDELAGHMNAYDNQMEMKREAIADKSIWTAKKRYILNVHDNEHVRYTTPKLKAMGIETAKSSTPAVCRKALEEALNLIMNGTENDVQEYIDKFEQTFYNLSVEEIAFPRGVNGLEKYSDSNSIFIKNTPIHVKGALLYNHLLKKHGVKTYEEIHSGEKIKFFYLKQPNPTGVNCLAVLNALPPQLDMEKYVNYQLQFEKAFVEPLQAILDKIGWNARPVASLEAFFED